MNTKVNPILIEMSQELPDSIHTYKYIQEPKSYEEIFVQARKEIFCLRNLERNMEDGQPAISFLKKSGYQFLFEESDEEDEMEERMRLLGKLQLIAELSEELAED
jgi:hypothetical protein